MQTKGVSSSRGRWQLFVFIAVALIWQSIPLVNIPLNWLETYYHEMSHGFMALLTGGSIQYIQLNLDGSGLCVTRGGWSMAITFAGYAGAALFGYVIYSAAHFSYFNVTAKKYNVSQWLNLVLIVLLVISTILWTRDLLTLLIQLGLMTLLSLTFFKIPARYLAYVFKFIALSVLLNALKSPLYLLDGRSMGDGARLAEMTLIPELFWVFIWCCLGIVCLFKLWQLTAAQK